MTSQSPNLAFYQAAATLFGVLLLTGVVAHLREPDAQARLAPAALVGLAAVGFTSLVGEAFALNVLIGPPASFFEQLAVEVCLLIGFGGVFAVAAAPTIQRIHVRRSVAFALGGVVVIALGVVAAIALLSATGDEPGLGAPAIAGPRFRLVDADPARFTLPRGSTASGVVALDYSGSGAIPCDELRLGVSRPPDAPVLFADTRGGTWAPTKNRVVLSDCTHELRKGDQVRWSFDLRVPRHIAPGEYRFYLAPVWEGHARYAPDILFRVRVLV